MLTRIARFIDQTPVRSALAAVAIVACVLLGPLAVVLIAFGTREPLLFAIGLGGIAGLLGACARIWLGPRFFLVSRLVRAVLASFLAAGTMAAFLAAFALPGRIYWTTIVSLVGLLGALVLAGSIRGGPGPNNSFKPKPLRGSA